MAKRDSKGYGVKNKRKALGVSKASQYSRKWKSASLEKAILKFVPGSKGLKTSTGKIIYKHNETGIQIVVDRAGRYSRIENINLAGKRRYLDLTGHIPSSKVINGKITGRNQKEYNQVTHFNNTD